MAVCKDTKSDSNLLVMYQIVKNSGMINSKTIDKTKRL